jgi:hypothetical protein
VTPADQLEGVSLLSVATIGNRLKIVNSKTEYFSPLVDKYLLAWIGPSTWTSFHQADLGRFYKFIKALSRYSRKSITQTLSSTVVSSAQDVHPEMSPREIQNVAQEYCEIAQHLLQFMQAPFPDPLIEMRNPNDVFLHLRSLRVYHHDRGWIDMYSLEEIEEFLGAHFGEGWETDPRWNPATTSRK